MQFSASCCNEDAINEEYNQKKCNDIRPLNPLQAFISLHCKCPRPGHRKKSSDISVAALFANIIINLYG